MSPYSSLKISSGMGCRTWNHLKIILLNLDLLILWLCMITLKLICLSLGEHFFFLTDLLITRFLFKLWLTSFIIDHTNDRFVSQSPCLTSATSIMGICNDPDQHVVSNLFLKADNDIQCLWSLLPKTKMNFVMNFLFRNIYLHIHQHVCIGL